jgi:antitoxin HicB
MSADYVFAVRLERDGTDPGFVVTCAELPEVVTQGESREDALAQAGDAIEEAVAGRLRRGEPVPVGSPMDDCADLVPLSPVLAAKAALSRALEEAGTTRVALAEVIGCDEKEVRRLLDPRHASKMARLARALDALGKTLVLRVVDRVA